MVRRDGRQLVILFFGQQTHKEHSWERIITQNQKVKGGEESCNWKETIKIFPSFNVRHLARKSFLAIVSLKHRIQRHYQHPLFVETQLSCAFTFGVLLNGVIYHLTLKFFNLFNLLSFYTRSKHVCLLVHERERERVYIKGKNTWVEKK